MKDLEVSVDFYVEKLGFDLEFRDEGEFTILCREVDLRNQMAKTVVDGYAIYDLHIICEPGTVNALWKEYREAGVPMPDSFDGGHVNRPYEICYFFIYVPDGYDLVFVAPIESGKNVGES